MLNKLSFNIFNELNESETEKYKIKKKVLIESNEIKTIAAEGPGKDENSLNETSYFDSMDFEQEIPRRMRFKEYDVVNYNDLYWVTQEPFSNEDLEEFANAFKNTPFTKAYVTVRDFSTYDFNQDKNANVFAIVDKSGITDTSGYDKALKDAGWYEYLNENSYKKNSALTEEYSENLGLVKIEFECNECGHNWIEDYEDYFSDEDDLNEILENGDGSIDCPECGGNDIKWKDVNIIEENKSVCEKCGKEPCECDKTLNEKDSEKLGGDPEDFISDVQTILDTLNQIDTSSFGTHLAQQMVEDWIETCERQIEKGKRLASGDEFYSESSLTEDDNDIMKLIKKSIKNGKLPDEIKYKGKTYKQFYVMNSDNSGETSDIYYCNMENTPSGDPQESNDYFFVKMALNKTDRGYNGIKEIRFVEDLTESSLTEDSLKEDEYGDNPIETNDKYELYKSMKGIDIDGITYGSYLVRDNNGNGVRSFIAKNDIEASKKFNESSMNEDSIEDAKNNSIKKGLYSESMPDDWYDEMFSKYVPKNGKSDTTGGEILRTFSFVSYMFLQNGDKIWRNNMKNNSHVLDPEADTLYDLLPQEGKDLMQTMANSTTYNAYKKRLDKLEDYIYNYLNNNKSLFESKEVIDEAEENTEIDWDKPRYGDDILDNMWTAVCSNDLNYVKNAFNKDMIKPNTRYQTGTGKHSLIMGALRNNNFEMVDLLKSFGEKIQKSELEEYKKIMSSREYEDDLTKSSIEEAEEMQVKNLQVIKEQGNVYMLQDENKKMIVGENYNPDEGMIENAEVYENKDEADKDYLNRCEILKGGEKLKSNKNSDELKESASDRYQVGIDLYKHRITRALKNHNLKELNEILKAAKEKFSKNEYLELEKFSKKAPNK